MNVQKFQDDSRTVIRQHIESAIEQCESIASEWQQVLNVEPRVINKDGDLEFCDSNRAKVLERNAEQVGDISDQLAKVLEQMEDLFHGSTQFISVDAEIRDDTGKELRERAMNTVDHSDRHPVLRTALNTMSQLCISLDEINRTGQLVAQPSGVDPLQGGLK